MPRLQLITKLLGLALLLGQGGCSPSGLQGNVFSQGDVRFRVGPVPDRWQALESVDGDLAALAFREEQRNLTIGAAGRCERDGDDVPLRALTQHLYIGFTARRIHEEKEFMLDGRAALRTEMSASLDGVAKELVFVVVKKDGCVYDFWRIAEEESDTARFDAFVGGFQTVN